MLALATVVNRASNQFFSAAGLTKNQDGGVGGSDRLNPVEYINEAFAVADDLFEIVLFFNLFLQTYVLCFELFP